MSLYPLSNTWDTKYVTVSNTWARKDTVTSNCTKYTLCSGNCSNRSDDNCIGSCCNCVVDLDDFEHDGCDDDYDQNDDKDTA